MTALILEPHQDDVALFCAYTAIREQATIVTVLAESQNQEGVTARERNNENDLAFKILGLNGQTWPWPYSDADPDWEGIRDDLAMLASQPEPGRGHLRYADFGTYDRVFAPWPERGGHEQHNRIGELARDIFGDRVTFYATYRVGGPRTQGTPVPYEREWVLRKLRALACYESQILRGPVRFFTHSLEEWTMP